MSEKGVVKLNPTKEVMKQGSKVEREKHEQDYTAPKETHRPVAADEGHETKVFPHSHPMMQTRHSHPANLKHADGRFESEDTHHAVKQMKGKY